MRPGLRYTALVLVVALAGVTLALQGWRSWTVDNDLVEYIDAAHALISSGRIPDHGVVTSLGSYAPPGLAWLGVPGALWLPDPQLLDVPGNVLLHLGTLAGIFVLARAVFGARAAVLAVLLYGLSDRGLLFAGSLGSAYPGPRAHPFFYVWMTYFAYQWVTRRDARYLGAALTVWAVGMYVFMELAPAIVMLPVMWAIYRPPIAVRPVAMAFALSLVIWFPYLRFESTRQMADVQSQLLMRRLEAADYVPTLCFLTRAQVSHDRPIETVVEHHNPQNGFLLSAGRRVLSIVDGLVVNFQSIVPGAGVVLFALTAAALLLMLGVDVGASATWPVPVGMTLLVVSVLANDVSIRRLLGDVVWWRPEVIASIHAFDVLLTLTGGALLLRGALTSLARRAKRTEPIASGDARIIAVALIVPWSLLLILSEWGRQDRLMGLWPLQIIVLAFVAGVMFDAMWPHGPVRHLAIAAVGVLIIANPFVSSRIGDWYRDGWTGHESADTEAADFVASLVRAAGRDRATIGYRVFEDTPPTPPWRYVDTRWRYGEELDVLLQYRDAISNLNRCGEGLSTGDEYRIVVPRPPSSEYVYYFDVPTDRRMHFVKQFGPYQVFEQDHQ
jgi:hypothetical protein